MKRTRTITRRALATLLLSCLAPSAMPAAAAPPPPSAPPVQLVETRPVESVLGNPALPTALEAWLDIIGSATRTLDFEEFYLSTWPGEPTEEVLAALGKAAKRGVKVRLILDTRMHRTYPRPAASLAGLPGFAVRIVDFGRIAGGVQHAKFFITDGATVFLGSQNFDWRALKHIHELGVRVRDARVAADFARVFEMDWDAATPVGQTPDTTRTFRATQQAHAPAALPYRIV